MSLFFERCLDKKRVFVTGGRRGLGQALCVACAKHGADLAYNYVTEGQGETLSLIQDQGRRALSFQVNVLDGEGFHKAIEQVEAEWGGIDILINNAGVSDPFPFPLVEPDNWDQIIDVNVKGTFLCSRAVLRGMIRRRSGVILNISSIAGLRMIDTPVSYATSKAAIKGFTMSLAKEMARFGIRVNSLAPGLLEDGLGQMIPSHHLESYKRHNAMGRVGTLLEVAKLAVFLVSDKNSYMSGETIIMDGGL